MIVADTNVLAYWYRPSEYTPLTEQRLPMDSSWAAPALRRRGFQKVLALEWCLKGPLEKRCIQLPAGAHC